MVITFALIGRYGPLSFPFHIVFVCLLVIVFLQVVLGIQEKSGMPFNDVQNLKENLECK